MGLMNVNQLVTRAKQLMVISQAATINPGAPDTYKVSPLGDTGTLEHARRMETSTCLPVSLERLQSALRWYLIRAWLSSHSYEDNLIGFFHGKTGHIHLLRLAVSQGCEPIKNSSVGYSPMESMSICPASHQHLMFPGRLLQKVRAPD